jgi:hypothetical protein
MGMQFILPRDGAVALDLVVRLGYDRELLAAVGNSEEQRVTSVADLSREFFWERREHRLDK